MNEQENALVALSFLENLSAGKIDAALDLIADNVVWWLAGEPQQFAIAGTKNKAELAEMLATIGKGMPNGIRLTITGVTAQGDRVAPNARMNTVTTAAFIAIRIVMNIRWPRKTSAGRSGDACIPT